MNDRLTLVAFASASIGRGSQSFAAASKLFTPVVRERAWLLYAWCRAADDMTDGQDHGHGSRPLHDRAAAQSLLENLTFEALDGNGPIPPAFAALRQVAREAGLPRYLIEDHLFGFALDAQGWRPADEADLLRYCYHVAGSVGCLMAIIMGVDPSDEETLNRACDLGIAFQLANIARDIVPDSLTGRCYLPADWMAEEEVSPAGLTDIANREILARMATRLITLSHPYRRSARIGAARLPWRSRLAVLAADAIYGAIGEKVVTAGPSAWDRRVSVSTTTKGMLLGIAWLRSLHSPRPQERTGLWTRPVRRSEREGSEDAPLPMRATLGRAVPAEAHKEIRS